MEMLGKQNLKVFELLSKLSNNKILVVMEFNKNKLEQ
jgi:hypothetical protein